MTKFVTTLEQLRAQHACLSGYNRGVRALQGLPFSEADKDLETYLECDFEGEIALTDIAEQCSLEDALWSLRAVADDVERDARLFAVWCARQAQALMADQRSIDALDVAERFANGDATEEELAVAWVAASAAASAAWAAAWAAAYAAAWSAYDAAYDAVINADPTLEQPIKEMFILMCNGAAPWQN